MCGKAPLFRGYLRVVDRCGHCGTELERVRADDAPPYFTIFATGHVVVPLMFWMERAYEPALWVHAAIWLPVTAAMAVLLLRPIKGATVGLMLRLGLNKPADETG